MKKPVQSISTTCLCSSFRCREPRNRRTIVHRKVKYSAIRKTGFWRKPAVHCMVYLCGESARCGGIGRCFYITLLILGVQATDHFTGNVKRVAGEQHIAGWVKFQDNVKSMGLSVFLQKGRHAVVKLLLQP